MPTRRNALKTLAGATVVGSLSGCVQIATQETSAFHGTPAMVDIYRGRDDVSVLSSAVSVEAHKTVERAGITREIVAHSWGMLYVDLHPDDRYGSIDNTESSSQQQSVMKARSAIATFATPSIEIAGQELNPIKDVTVADIGTELLATVRNGTAWPGRNSQKLTTSAVQKATGKKVMRAFRDAFGDENQVVIDARETTDATYVEFDIDGDGTYEIETEWPTTTPDWNGDTYSPSYKVDAAGYDSGADDPWSVIIRFDKHNGDFVVLFGIAPANDSGNKFLEPVQNDFDSFNFKHPIDDDFTQEELLRHLAETNLQGARRVASQVRELVDDTQELLAEAENETRNEEDERFAVITDTQDELEQVEEIWVNVGNGLESLTVDTLLGGTGEDTIRRLQERSDEAVEVATRAHDRVANYNNTRNEEDERFLQIERNLSGIVARTKYLASETDNNYAWYEGWS